MGPFTTQAGQPVALGEVIGRGGEGTVYRLHGPTDRVAKIYHANKRDRDRYEKLVAMLTNPPIDYTQRLSPPHVSIAWPTDLILEAGAFAGYLMPRVARSTKLFKVYVPSERRRTYPGWDWRYLHRTALNLVTAIGALHAREYVVGDINQNNVFVTEQALVTLVDTDSFQVRARSGWLYRCAVCTPEYTPRELQGLPIQTVDRTLHHDAFGTAVLIFQLLMEGFHPFTGATVNPSQSLGSEVHLYAIKNGIYPYEANGSLKPPPAAPTLEEIDPTLRKLFRACFVAGHAAPERRPTMDQWRAALSVAERNLVQCRQSSNHWHSQHVRACPWCRRDKASRITKKQGSYQQRPLPTPKIPSRPKVQAQPQRTPLFGAPSPVQSTAPPQQRRVISYQARPKVYPGVHQPTTANSQKQSLRPIAFLIAVLLIGVWISSVYRSAAKSTNQAAINPVRPRLEATIAKRDTISDARVQQPSLTSTPSRPPTPVPTRRLLPVTRIVTQPPGASVTINKGEFSGTTPFTARLRPGAHGLKIDLAGHRTYLTMIHVSKNDRTFKFTLQRE